jgi:hypothetical protein
MPEISQNKTEQANVTDEGLGQEKVSGLGALLKGERERKGFSYEQMSQVTRLRIHFLEALENEDWPNLPPSVFVRGFIRSYAKALGLDESKLLDLYRGAVAEDAEPSIPIREPQKSKKGLLLLLALLLGAAIVTLYLWIGRPPSEHAPAQIKGAPASEIEGGQRGEIHPPKLKTEGPPSGEKQRAGAQLTNPNEGLAAMGVPEQMPGEKEQHEYPVDEALLVAPTAEPTGTTESLVLAGIVRSRTWIKIYVDDEPPKEYILQSGSRPQWKAKKGFYLLVGNAAGIDFNFSGQQISNLGEMGEVVSLRLPEDFDRTISED